MDKFMQSLVDAPLANPLRLNLVEVEGAPKKRSPSKRTLQMFQAPAPIVKNAREYKERQFNAKIKTMLDYYATTKVPFNRIAEHMNLSVEQVTESMSFRGRKA
ncbi:hypothetical protein ACFSTI_25010 [Rhizorhabdus histidinilytica]|uniref:Uncharacterized protein n=1 Tax=Rhizorhabdus histidinilytica TaxID=439228 RepID=A0A1T5A8D6_9SPHN|nr:hypothetical protein [Rhizorhabdus histidinilytica]SKB31186.1 hypothetical protein SAMN06295920_101695 [Rhizorhabdus histidinilytica]